MSDEDAQLVALLDEKIEHHRARMEFHRAALEAYEGARALQKGELPAPPARPRTVNVRTRSTSGTGQLVEAALKRHGPRTVPEITQILLDAGWHTKSADPVNNVRTQVGRAIAAGRLVKLEDGRVDLAGVMAERH